MFRKLLCFAIVCILVIMFAQVLTAAPNKPESAGVFVDRNGAKHVWRVNQAHTLIWDNKPYLPVGGMICSPYDWDPSETGLQNAKAQFDMLKQKGIIDLYFNFAGPGILPAERLQRLIDYLDQIGMRYGIEISEGPGSGPGYIVERSGPEIEHIDKSGTYGVEANDAIGGIYLLVDESTGDVLKTGQANISEKEELTGKINESGQPEVVKKKRLETYAECASGKKLCLYFTKQVNGGAPYFWDGGFEKYRDYIVSHYRKVKFGKGFRFVVDPLFNEMIISHNFLPSSPQYAREFSEWLIKRYGNVNSLQKAWAVKVTGFDIASRLVPLRVLQSKGAETGVLYDPADGKTYISDATKSQAWYDYIEFSGESITHYINLVCDALKKVADVPMVLKHSTAIAKYHINMEKTGFDGIGMEPYGVGEALVPMNGAVCYSEAEQSAKTMWLLVTEFSQAAFENQCDVIGYSDRANMYADCSTLLGSGAKGLFFFGFTFWPRQSNQFWKSEYIRDPRQLQWMATYRRIMESSTKLVDYRPTYYYRFPTQREEQFIFGRYEHDFAGIDGNWIGQNGGDSHSISRAADKTWILPTWDIYVDSPLVIANLSNTPASLRWGNDLNRAIRKGSKMIAYVGFRHDLGTIPLLDKYFTDEFAADPDGRKFQVLKPTPTSRVIGRTLDGKVWNLADGKLQIISEEVVDKEGWMPDGLLLPKANNISAAERFQCEVLGVTDIRLGDGIHGFTFHDRSTPVAYLWAEDQGKNLRLNSKSSTKIRTYYENGEPTTAVNAEFQIPPIQTPELTEAPASHLEGKHYATASWKEALVVEGVDARKLLKTAKPVQSPADIRIMATEPSESNFNVGTYGAVTKALSGGLWSLATFADPPLNTGYYVKYAFNSSRAGIHDLWIREWTNKSPCRWRINGGDWHDAPDTLADVDAKSAGPWAFYDDGKIMLAWHNYGQAELSEGRNILEIQIKAKRKKGDKYCKFLDAIDFRQTADGK